LGPLKNGVSYILKGNYKAVTHFIDIFYYKISLVLVS
jgi:hypothetical protein